MAAGDLRNGARPCLVRIFGDCMAPRIPPGAWVTVDPDRRAAPGDVVLVRDYDGCPRVRRLVEIGGRPHAVADRSRSGPRPIEDEDAVLGVVVAVTHPP